MNNHESYNVHPNRWFASLLALMAFMSIEAQTATEQPRLLVHIIVDQLRTDYMQAFESLYGENGFKRLIAQGRCYYDVQQPFNTPDRASATASIVTGTTPAEHGIIALKWLSRQTLQPISCVEDHAFKGLQTSETSSASQLLTTTIVDELEIATSKHAINYAIAPDRDMAILMAGHISDGAFWINDQTGAWCGTSYYGRYPSWASVYERVSPLSARIGSLSWTPIYDGALPDFLYYHQAPKSSTDFSHSFSGASRFRQLKATALVNDEVCNFVSRCVQGSYIGRDRVPDILSIGLYAGNYEQKSILQAPSELQDTYVRLDSVVANLITFFEKTFGSDGIAFVLSSTCYNQASCDENIMQEYRLATGTFSMQRASMLLNMYLVASYGKEQYVEGVYGNNIYLNHKLIEQRQLNINDVLMRCEEFLGQMAGVRNAYSARSIALGAWNKDVQRVSAGWCQQRSGDIYLDISPGWEIVDAKGDTITASNDATASYPLFILAPDIQPEQIKVPVLTTAIAPTLARCLRIRAPNGSTQAPLVLK